MNKPPSKNPQAEELCGMRPKGNALFQPSELGYACPICGASSYPELRWSEYALFLWCSVCNIDIPSCLCVKYYEPKLSNRQMKPRQRIEKATALFLDCVKEAKNRSAKCATE